MLIGGATYTNFTVFVFLVQTNLCIFFMACLYICCHWRSCDQKRRIGIPWTSL